MYEKTEQDIIKNWIGDINKPLVSIKCLAYNHEKVIKNALDGFLMQKTNFPFEIIVHDDASHDKTASIIKEYEKEYPLIIKPIYENENQYSKKDDSLNEIISSRIKGKYVAYCEGDDYWIDENKLQNQIDYLESNEKCSLVLTNCYEEDFVKHSRTEGYPYSSNKGLYSRKIPINEIIMEKGTLPPTCSIVVRASSINSMPPFFKKAPVGDKPLRFYMASIGDIYYMNKITCVHRFNVEGSFGVRVKNKKIASMVYNEMNTFFDNYNCYTDYKYQKEIEYAKSVSHFSYCTRAKKLFGLLKNSYFQSNFSLKSKAKIIILLVVPEKIKKILKGVIKNDK